MLAKSWSLGLRGIDGFAVSVEVDVAPGLPTFAIVGLPDAEVRESKERVVAALRNSGFDVPLKRITVNLGPAEIKKGGAHFDLPIAVGVLAASGQLAENSLRLLEEMFFVGELSLDGSLRPAAGVLPMLSALLRHKNSGVIVPVQNAAEAGVSEAAALSASTLTEVAAYLNGKTELSVCVGGEMPARSEAVKCAGDFSEVKGQPLAKRALEIAAAGGHNVLMFGPPGSGKSMLAKRFSGILPPMTKGESLEVTRIYSAGGYLKTSGLICSRPFRDPHHTISDVALIGGGTNPRPGEVSLAHAGVLFLDELPEFSRASLEVLREPMEAFEVTISRAKDKVCFPARFMLIAAMNPCPCGHLGNPEKRCSCTPLQVKRYRSRISGPLLDRIDISVQLSPVKYAEWSGAESESSAAILSRVLAARAAQSARFSGGSTVANAYMSNADIRRFCALPEGGGEILETAMKRLGLSARSLDKILKVSRTVADLEGSENIRKEHLVEVIQYRSMDRTSFLE